MAKPPATASSVETLIAGQYVVDMARPLAAAGGGLPAFAVTDLETNRGDLMALRLQRHIVPRAQALLALRTPIEHLLTPLAHGPGPPSTVEPAYYVVAIAPSGPPVSVDLQPWPEAALIAQVLRPAALMLDRLADRGVTHRAIRPNNVFCGETGQPWRRPVVFGAAWAAPPASLQPAVFEPPYSAMCLANGRGEGSIADDVYALGVLLLTLALGRMPLDGSDDNAVVHRKLEFGSYAALVGDQRLPAVIGDLARGMLAEDPDHRPVPALLLDPAAARSRRVAARPPRRAPHPLKFAGQTIWDTRSLAYGLARQPAQALLALRAGAVESWIRRELGDAVLGAHIEEIVRHSGDPAAEEGFADAMLIMRAVCLVDPLAPLCWRGIAVWPDGLGPVLASLPAGDPQIGAWLLELIAAEAQGTWGSGRPERCDLMVLRVEARQLHGWLQMRGPAGGLRRLIYQLNPLYACLSPLLAGHCVARLIDLLPALEAVAATVDREQLRPVDADVAAFVAARSDHRTEVDAANQARPETDAAAMSAQLRLLAQLQLRHYPRPLPGLAGWLVDQAGPLLATWSNRQRRAAIAEQLRALVPAGQLAAILALAEDPAGHGLDAQEARTAAAALARIDRELRQIATGAAARGEMAQHLGQEIAASVGLTVLALLLALAALG
jgi:eukaryotic-like serine/threonine-protein kinase